MIWKQATILLSFALCVLSDDGHKAISEQRVKINYKVHNKHHGELSHIGSNKPEHHEEYASSYPSYEFSYKVHDPHTHDMKGQKESRDGDEVKGEYWLVEPDGRKRTVTYHADKHSGFHATVHYSDDHHHLEHHHEEKHNEEHHDPEPKKEEKSGDEGAGDEAGHGGEESPKAEEGNEEAAAEEEGEGGRGAEETRGHEEEVGRWIHDRFWGHRDDGRHRDHRLHHGDDIRKNQHSLDHHIVREDEGHKREEEPKDIGLGSYGCRNGHERAQWHGHDNWHGRDEGKAESRQELRDERAYRIHKSGTIVRENYNMHPRFYRHNRSQRKSASQ